MDFALAHKYWTLDGWKRVIWSDNTGVNCLGSGGGKWMWKKTEEGLSDRLVEGTIKFRGGCGAVCSGMGWICL